jgi:transcriptional regulator with XRE-family HTH domain
VVPSAPTDLDKKFAAFLKKQRGEMSYAAFSKKTGFTASSLFRLEQGQQSITLGRLHEVLKRLKMTLGDVFSELKQ